MYNLFIYTFLDQTSSANQMLCKRLISRPIGLRQIWSRGLVAKPFEDMSISHEIYKPDDSDHGILTSANIPEYFNFTRDVIDKWAEVQKVLLRNLKTRLKVTLAHYF